MAACYDISDGCFELQVGAQGLRLQALAAAVSFEAFCQHAGGLGARLGFAGLPWAGVRVAEPKEQLEGKEPREEEDHLEEEEQPQGKGEGGDVLPSLPSVPPFPLLTHMADDIQAMIATAHVDKEVAHTDALIGKTGIEGESCAVDNADIIRSMSDTANADAEGTKRADTLMDATGVDREDCTMDKTDSTRLMSDTAHADAAGTTRTDTLMDKTGIEKEDCTMDKTADTRSKSETAHADVWRSTLADPFIDRAGIEQESSIDMDRPHALHDVESKGKVVTNFEDAEVEQKDEGDEGGGPKIEQADETKAKEFKKRKNNMPQHVKEGSHAWEQLRLKWMAWTMKMTGALNALDRLAQRIEAGGQAGVSEQEALLARVEQLKDEYAAQQLMEFDGKDYFG